MPNRSKLSYFFVIWIFFSAFYQNLFMNFGEYEHFVEYQWLERLGFPEIFLPLANIAFVVSLIALMLWIWPKYPKTFQIILFSTIFLALKDVFFWVITLTDLEFTSSAYEISRKARGLPHHEAPSSTIGIISGIGLAIWYAFIFKAISLNKKYLVPTKEF